MAIRLVAVVLLVAACDAAPSGTPVPAAPEPTTAGAIEGPELLVDPAGFFRSAAPVSGAWWGGDGVPCLVPLQGATDGRTLHGRLADGALLWQLADDGAYAAHRPVIRISEVSLADEVRGALRDAFAEASDDLPDAFVRRAQGLSLDPPRVFDPPAPPPDRVPLEHAVALRERGVPLLARAPADAFVAHFRSVEAGYRFAGLADDLSRVLASPDVARRDFGTLRLTLHGLLLPTIWRTNPGGQKGVSECALVVVPPFGRGPLAAAVLLRITDFENHLMDVRAGVAIEARPEHLWRPPDDPFPQLRVRDNARAWDDDVEITAAGATALDALSPRRRDPDEASPEAIAARWDLPPAPGSRRALVLETPPTWGCMPTDEERLEAGFGRLLETWSGLALPLAGCSLAGELPPPASWSGVRALCADTDARGAVVSVRLDDAGRAAALGDLLRRPPPSPAEALAACADNLLDLVPLALVEPRSGDMSERCFVWLGFRPVCLSGGRYVVHPITGVPSCSLHGERDAPLEAAGGPPSPISDVVVDGTLVTFRLRIDWARRE